MPGFDPFSEGATEVLDKPAEFDPFASGSATLTNPEPMAAPKAPKETDSSPKIGADTDSFRSPDTHWQNLYAGLDDLDARLMPEERAVFQRLDSVSDNSKAARAQAINQSYVQSLTPDISHSVMERNWPAIRDATANHLGISGKDITDTQLYGAISKQFQEHTKAQQESEAGEVKPWTWTDRFGSTAYEFKRTLGNFWEGVNKPIAELPEAPKDLPDLQGLGLHNPALVGGIYNAVKPLIEGVESPLGIGTLAIAAPLKAAAETMPLAKAALVGIGGVFTGLMGYGTAKKTMEAPKILKDPNASFQDKVQAVVAPVAEGAMTILGALGTAMEALPAPKAKGLVSDLNGKNPAEAAQVLRKLSEEIKAEQAPKEPVEGETAKSEPTEQPQEYSPQVHDFLENAATELDRIASVEAKTAVKETVKEEAATAAKEAKEAEKTAAAEAKAEVEAEATIAKEVPAEAKETGAVGIRNASVDAELESMGLPKATHGEKTTFAAELEKAGEQLKKDPTSGERLIDELNKEARPVTATEDAVLVREMNKRRLERDAAEEEYLSANESGDQANKMDALVRVNKAQEAFQKAAEASTQAGTKNAQALALRRMMLKEDYSLAAMERKARVANEGKPLADEAQAQIRDLHKRITETQKAFDDYIAEQNRKSPPPIEKPSRVPASRPPSGKARQFLSDQAAKARERIKARQAEGRTFSNPLDPQAAADAAIIGAEYIARGVAELGAWSEAMVKELGEHIRPYLKDIFEQSQDAKDQAGRLQAYKARTKTQIEKVKGKLESGDLEPEPKKTPLHLDEEANRLQSEVDMLKLEFKRQVEKQRYENSSALSKVKENALNLYDTARLLMTTGEFSFILRQGKVGVLSHPIMAAKALPNMFRAFLEDPAGAHALNLEVLNSPEAAAAKSAKLHLVDEGASLNKQEEFLMGKMVEQKAVLQKTVGRFNQAATVFLNRLRLDMWKTMRKVGMSPAEEKQLAMFVNEATGRGTLGSLEAAAVPLGRIMFSPRYFASRIQLATGHSLWGGTARTRMVIAREYAKTLVGLGVYYSALKLAFGDEADIGDDPRSSDFGKVKIGNSRIDPLAGIAQVAVFAARTATGEKTSTKGKTTPIRGDDVPYGGEKWSDVATNFARSKLHPVPGAIVNLFNGTDLSGKEADAFNQLKGMAAPVTYLDIFQALEEQDLPEGAALGLLALFGEGLQTYDANQKKVKLRK